MMRERKSLCSGRVLALLGVAATLMVLPASAASMPTPKHCPSPLRGTYHVRVSTFVSCSTARWVVKSRETKGHAPSGWNCSLSRKRSHSRFFTKSCKQGAASGGWTITYWVLHPKAYTAVS